ncbi:MAG: hypothetical protein KME12_05055 [Trichocoleus desertorum ATA4-8-CV12]|jgi:hypothetical protein|nr:hypothetical protein [Trichocoleus desertorum ATA4-8-CV12]
MLKLLSGLSSTTTALLLTVPAIAQVNVPRPATQVKPNLDPPICYMQTEGNQLINLENLCGQQLPSTTVIAFNCNSDARGNYINSRSGGGSVYVPADIRKGEAYERQSQCG